MLGTVYVSCQTPKSLRGMRTLRPARCSSTAATFVDVITVPVTVSPLWKTGSLIATARICGGASAGSVSGVGSGVGAGSGVADGTGVALGETVGEGLGLTGGVTLGNTLGVGLGTALGELTGNALADGEGDGAGVCCAITLEGTRASMAPPRMIAARNDLNM